MADSATTVNNSTTKPQRLNVLRCDMCGDRFKVRGWRLRCPKCIAALARAMHAALDPVKEQATP